jgi:hypothetical protein
LNKSPNALLASCEKYKIQNNFLYELITYGDGLSKDQRVNIGNWSNYEPMAVGVLTWLAMRAFDVHRLPWCSDRNMATVPGEYKRVEILEDVSAVSAICTEFKTLQMHTVSQLKGSAKTVRLARALGDVSNTVDPYLQVQSTGYATLVAKLDAAANHLQRKKFHIEMDVLNSWHGGGGYGGGKNVVMTVDVPKTDVLWVSQVVASRDSKNSERSAVESGEWIVINRSPSGVVALQVGCIEVPQEMKAQLDEWVKRSKKAELEKFLEEWKSRTRPEALVRRQQTYFGKRLKKSFSQRVKDAIYTLKDDSISSYR